MVGGNSREEELRDHLGVAFMNQVINAVLRVKKLSCVSLGHKVRWYRVITSLYEGRFLFRE